MSDTLKQLQDNCQSIADELRDPDKWREEYISDCSDDEQGALSPDDIGAYEWLEDVLDITYRVSQDREYKSAKVCVAWGGPNIYVDTESSTVIGYWGSNKVEVPYTDNLGLDEALEQMWRDF